MKERYLELTQLGKSYPTASGDAVIVRDFNLRIREGEFVTLIGHSGCGKSTVLSILMGLNEATEGGVILDGREISGPGVDRGIVFQSPALLPWLTVGANVQLAIDQSIPATTGTPRHSVDEYLEMVGLAGMAACYPHEISSGMRQRVGVARAFALEPKVLLLDEPFSLLDAITRMELQDELMRIWEEHRRTVVMVTHDVDEALLLSDRIVMMTSGPAATVGGIVEVELPRPRLREELSEDDTYYAYREQVLSFLESPLAHGTAGNATSTATEVASAAEVENPSDSLAHCAPAA